MLRFIVPSVSIMQTTDTTYCAKLKGNRSDVDVVLLRLFCCQLCINMFPLPPHMSLPPSLFLEFQFNIACIILIFFALAFLS